jgi:hypothetical protein
MTSVNCVASSNACDGFNYHASQTNPYVPRFLEVGCEAYRNGWGSLDVPETQNGSTSHDGVVGQRINGNYHDNYGPNIADVLGAQTWSVGCLATSSTSPNRGWGAGSSDAGTIMWMQDCTIANNPWSGVRAELESVMYMRGCTLRGNRDDIEQFRGGTVTSF